MSQRLIGEIIEDLRECAHQLSEATQYWKKSVCLDAATCIEQLMERLKKDQTSDLELSDEQLKNMTREELDKAFAYWKSKEVPYREPSDWDHHFETPEQMKERDALIERKKK